MTFGQRGLNPAPAAGGPASQVTVEYVERPGLLWLSIKNFLLGLVTLSIYRFWQRRMFVATFGHRSEINDEPLEYTGTGGELFLGALIILCALILPFVGGILALHFIYGPEHFLTLPRPVRLFSDRLPALGHGDLSGPPLSFVAHVVARHPRHPHRIVNLVQHVVFRRDASTQYHLGVVDTGHEPKHSGTPDWRYEVRRNPISFLRRRRAALCPLCAVLAGNTGSFCCC